MTKQEFLSYLEKRLGVLKKQEIQDILEEYAQHIEIKMQGGKTEEEAISDFGDVEELVEEILEAYNVDPHYGEHRFEQSATGFLKKLASGMNVVSERILSMNGKEIWNILVKLFVLVICLIIVRIPVELIKDTILWGVRILPYFLERPLEWLVEAFFSLAYLALVLYTLYVFLKRFVLQTKEGEDQSAGAQTNYEYQSSGNEAGHRGFTVRLPKIYKPNFENMFHKEEGDAASRDHGGKESPTLGDVLGKIFAFCWKCIVVCVLIPIILMDLMATVAFGVLFVLMFQGYPVIGLTILAAGAALCGVALTFMMVKGTWKGGRNV